MHETSAVVPQAGGWTLGAFIGYLLLIIIIGVFSSRFSSAGMTEFFLAGRKLNRWIVALSAVVSGRSAWLMIGFTGMAYKMGASALWAAVGYITVELFLFLFYAGRLRRFSEATDSITLPDFYAERFNDKVGSLRILLTIIILLFMTAYVSAQFVGGGKTFSASFGVAQNSGMLITAAIVLIYTLLGGFLAVSLTDFLQALFMIIGLVILPIIAFGDKGGFAAAMIELKSLDVGMVDPMAISIGALIHFVGIGLGSPGNPHILVRYMSIDDPKQLRVSAVAGTSWNIVMAAGALFVGMLGRAYFPTTETIPGADVEHIYPILAQMHLHPILFGVVIASIFAAIMSTADSQLLVAASSVVHDIYEKILKKGHDVSQRTLVFYSRIIVFILVLLAVGFGAVASKLVFWLVLFAWAGLGASIGPTSILALFWKRTTKAGVMAGLIAGTVTTIVWYYIPALKGFIYELIPAFIIGLLATIFVSLATQPPEDADEMFSKMSG